MSSCTIPSAFTTCLNGFKCPPLLSTNRATIRVNEYRPVCAQLGNPTIVRKSASYPSSIWDHDFLQSLGSGYTVLTISTMIIFFFIFVILINLFSFLHWKFGTYQKLNAAGWNISKTSRKAEGKSKEND